MTTILKALVGSRAHGLNGPDSDWDWRGIYVQPTNEILSMGHVARSVQWLEGQTQGQTVFWVWRDLQLK